MHVPEGRADDKASRDGLENRDAELIGPQCLGHNRAVWPFVQLGQPDGPVPDTQGQGAQAGKRPSDPSRPGLGQIVRMTKLFPQPANGHPSGTGRREAGRIPMGRGGVVGDGDKGTTHAQSALTGRFECGLGLGGR